MLLSVLYIASSPAQEPDNNSAATAPNLYSLPSDWWSYFAGSRAKIEPRVDSFLENAGVQIARLAPQNQEVAQTVLDAVRGNLTAMLSLLDDTELTLHKLAPAALGYSIDDLLGLAATARDARSGAAEEQHVLDRDKRVLNRTD